MNEKIIIYQTLPRISGNQVEKPVPGYSFEVNGTGKFADYSVEKLEYVKNLGCSYIWFTGIIEHATQSICLGQSCLPDSPQIVKGVAGSPYAIKDYYDVAHYLAVNHDRRVEEFEELVERCHKSGLKVIIDFVPNHVSRNYNSDKNPGHFSDFGVNDNTNVSFATNNDFYYLPGKHFTSPAQLSTPENNRLNNYTEYPAKATGNDCFNESPSINDWYETVKLNYGIDYLAGKSRNFDPIPKLWDKMADIIHYWSRKGVDGFRCDMAEMVPEEFWHYLISEIKVEFPDLIFIAEIYDPDKYNSYLNSGFDFLYDKVGLYDTLIRVIKGDSSASDISKCWQSLGEIQDRMLNFLENHDEQRIASDFIASGPEKGIPAVAVSLLLNRAPFMIYFAQELGERGMDAEGYSGLDGRTSIFDFWSIKSIVNYNKGIYDIHLHQKYRFLLNIAKDEPSITAGQTYDLQFANRDNSNYLTSSTFSFARYYDSEIILVVVNFSESYIETKLNIPMHLFEHWGIRDGQHCIFTDLYTNYSGELQFSSKQPIHLKVDGYFIRIVKLLLQ